MPDGGSKLKDRSGDVDVDVPTAAVVVVVVIVVIVVIIVVVVIVIRTCFPKPFDVRSFRNFDMD
jgi:uncharacterized protein HemY